jgi:NADPH:quinone reductase-like Zn-dependent oxidoreductase
MRALQISTYGDPLKVLELVDVPEPGVPGVGEVLIDVELAPLSKHDLLFIRGFFGGPADANCRWKQGVRSGCSGRSWCCQR